jgi:hypothetical protein
MDDQITIALLTCDRSEYTRQTLQTLYAHNDLHRFALIHGDDCSAKKHNLKLAESYGFETVVRTKQRQGAQAMKRALAKACKTPWLLLLENDWECDRPFPWDLFERVDASDAYTFRLFHEFKERGKRRAGVNHYGREQAPPGWQPFGEGAEIGDIHWCSPPSVTRIQELRWLLEKKSERGSMALSGKIQRPVVRVTENVFYHIGESRTPGFVH